MIVYLTLLPYIFQPGIDLDIDFSGVLGTFAPDAILEYVPSQVTFHFGVEWPRCMECRCNAKPQVRDRTVAEWWDGTYLAGFTLHVPKKLQGITRGIGSRVLNAFKYIISFIQKKTKAHPEDQKDSGLHSSKVNFIKEIFKTVSVGPGIAHGVWSGAHNVNPDNYETGGHLYKEDDSFIECNRKRNSLMSYNNDTCPIRSNIRPCLPLITDYECPRSLNSNYKVGCEVRNMSVV